MISSYVVERRLKPETTTTSTTEPDEFDMVILLEQISQVIGKYLVSLRPTPWSDANRIGQSMDLSRSVVIGINRMSCDVSSRSRDLPRIAFRP